MSTRFFPRRVAAATSLTRKPRDNRRRRLRLESLEQRAMLAANILNVNGSWTSNGQAGTLSGTIAVDTITGYLSDLNLTRSAGNMATASYGFDAITTQGPTGTGGYGVTTAVRGSYELQMSWDTPSGSLATYAGGSVSSFSFTSPTLGMFILGKAGTISNANDAPTGIALSAAMVDENGPRGTAIGTLMTADADVGDTFAYSLVPGVGSTDNASFAIVGGQLTSATVFDFEAKTSYSVRIRSTDSGSLSTEKTFVISVTDVNDTASFGFGFKHINETGAETHLIETTGMRKYSEWQNPPITYWGPSANNAEGRLVYKFPFVAPSQSIRLLASSQLWDFFTEPGGSGRGASALEVSKDGTTWVSLRNALEPRAWGADWDYDDMLPAAVLGGRELWIRMRFYTESTPASSYTVAQFGRSTAAALKNMFTVQATLAQTSAPQDVQITSVAIAENQPVGTTVGTLSTTDPDTGDTFTYSLVSGTGATDNASFEIVGNELRTKASFDYEAKSSYLIRVRSIDSGGLWIENEFTVTVTDAVDAITLSTNHVAENVPLGTTVATIRRNDSQPDYTPLTVYYVASTGRMVLVNTTALPLVVQSVQILSPSAVLSGAVVSMPVGPAFSTSNKADGVSGVGSEIFFASIGTAAITLAGGDSWDFGFVAEVGLTTEQLLSAFSTDPQIDVLPGSSAGQFLYSLVGGEFTRGLIAYGFNRYTYSLVPGTGDTDNHVFTIEETNLKVAGGIDYETKSHYTIRVRSTDHDGTWTDEVLTLTATDVNEAPTAVSVVNEVATLREDVSTSIRMKVASFTTTDDALGANTFALAGEDALSFEIVNQSLFLRAGVSLDYETKPTYTVTVQVSDPSLVGSIPTLTTFTLSVTNVNESPTDLGGMSQNVAENTAVGTSVATLTSIDPDADDIFDYALVSGPGDANNGSFEIAGAALKTKAIFDYEAKSSYSIRVRTTDFGGLWTEKQLMVVIADVNEMPTAVTLAGATTILNEDVSVLSRIKVADILVTDDALGMNVLSLSGADMSCFEIIDASLYLRANVTLDYETKSSYAVIVQVGDTSLMGFAAASVAHTISLANVNETPTDLDVLPSSIEENTAAGTSVGTLTSADPDTSDVFRYALVVGPGDADNGSFEIAGTAVKTRGAFDYEAKHTYTIRVRTTDAGGLWMEKPLMVTVVDVNESPTAVNLIQTTTTLDENTLTLSRIKVADIIVTDDALGTNALMLSGADASEFDIDETSLYIRAGVWLDHETKALHTVTVFVEDSDQIAQASVSTTYTLSVTDVNEAPSEVGLLRSTITENSHSGAVVGAFTSTDPDAGDTATYALVSGTGDADNAEFEIVATILKTRTTFDYESKDSYSIRVRTTDTGGLATEKQLTVTVTDVNESPTMLSLAVAKTILNEDTPTSERFKVADISVTDDALGTNVLSLSGPDEAVFEIEGMSLYLRAGVRLDYETKASYAAMVSVADSELVGPASVYAAYTLTVANVNEAPMDLGLSTSIVAENDSIGAVVGMLTSTDPDKGDSPTYALVSGSGDADNGSFEIVGAVLMTKAACDYEKSSSYSIRVRSTDTGGLTSEKVFAISVTDVNEAPAAVTLVNAATSVPENTLMTDRYKVADIVISDDALGTNTLSLSGADEGFFEIDGMSLYLKAGTALDYGNKSSYRITVDASDDTAEDVVALTPLTLVYNSPTGRLILRNTTRDSLSLESVSILSPAQALSGVAAMLPAAAFTVLNTSDQGVHGLHSEIFFGNIGSPVLTLAAGDMWDLGGVAPAGLEASTLLEAFGTDTNADPEGGLAAGQFLYSISDGMSSSGLIRGVISRDISSAFALRVQGMPEYSGREYTEVPAGETVVDTTPRTGNRQVIVRGGGTLVLAGANTHTGGVKVEGGTLVVQNAAALGTGTLDVHSGATVTLTMPFVLVNNQLQQQKAKVGALVLASGAMINLGTSGLEIAAGGTTLANLRSAILLARNDGDWKGTSGIGSTNVDMFNNRRIGYRQTPSGAFQVAWAAFGDTNLDGRVNSIDISALNTARKFGLLTRDSHWSQGDFSFDGRVNSTDVQQLSAMFGKPSYYMAAAAASSATSTDTVRTSVITQLFVSLGGIDPKRDSEA